jgi:hypothetical protein
MTNLLAEDVSLSGALAHLDDGGDAVEFEPCFTTHSCWREPPKAAEKVRKVKAEHLEDMQDTNARLTAELLAIFPGFQTKKVSNSCNLNVYRPLCQNKWVSCNLIPEPEPERE